MTRKECLDAAAGCVLQDRNASYGGPEDSFGVIANFWSVYLGRKVYPHDVAMMMALLKIARIKGNHGYADGYIDLAGYAACGAECAMPDRPKAEGCEELVQDGGLAEECEGCLYRLEADAPQTKEELYERIVGCNPATYGTPHKPTGEELAEMAEENAHG